MKPKKTPWFPMSTPPKRVGRYECSSCSELHKWDGMYWHAEGSKWWPGDWYLRNAKWRGLVKEAK